MNNWQRYDLPLCHNRPFPSCPSLCFKARLSLKLLIWEWLFKQITHFQQKGFARSLLFKVRVFGTQKWPIGRNLFYEPIRAGVVHVINIPDAKHGIAIGRNGSAWIWCLFWLVEKASRIFLSNHLVKWFQIESTAKLLSVLICRLLKKQKQKETKQKPAKHYLAITLCSRLLSEKKNRFCSSDVCWKVRGMFWHKLNFCDLVCLCTAY